MKTSQPRLWLALRFIDLPLTAIRQDHDPRQPLAITEKKRIVFANETALDKGVVIGMDITTAEVLSGCAVLERSRTSESAALEKLSEKLYQFTPYITQQISKQRAQSGLLLELSSCLKLFSGIRLICDQITKCVSGTPFSFSTGLSYSASAAWYMSFAQYPVIGDETYSVFVERLNALSIELLFDFPKALESLTKMGFSTFGDIARQIEKQSISTFRKRLGHEFSELLNDLYAIDASFQQPNLFEKPREVFSPAEWFENEIEFGWPVSIVDHLKLEIENLLQQLCDYMRMRQQQCQYIEWTISDIGKRKEVIRVNADDPQTHWKLLYDLSLIQFESRELPFEVDTLKLTCRHFMPAQVSSQMLNFDQNRVRKKSPADFTITIAKLKARLGEASIHKLSYLDNSVPEFTNILITLAEKCNQQLSDVHANSLRPTWLLSPPISIQERSNRLFWNGYLSLVVGPERIISNWWEESIARDYYLAKRHDHVPVWIFFDLYEKKWFVHGVFA
jgi:protein ImuB